MNHEQPIPPEATQPARPEPPDESPRVWVPGEQLGEIFRRRSDEGDPAATLDRLPEADRPRIWVGSWLDYTNGVLYGQWIDADCGHADIWTAIQTMLANSPTAARYGEPAEEWGIFDHDNFGDATIGEQDSIARVSRIAEGITVHGPAFAAWADLTDFDRTGDELTGERFADTYLGEYESLESYIEQFNDDIGYNQLLDEALPDSIRRYVRLDTGAIARDMLAGGDVSTVPTNNGTVWIFDSSAIE